MGFLSKIWELLGLHSALPILKAKYFHLNHTSFKNQRSVLRWGEGCVLCRAGGAGAASLYWVVCSEVGSISAPRPQPMPSLGTLLPVTCTFLNLMGSLVYDSFPIAGKARSGDEWFIGKAAQGRLHGYYSSALIRNPKARWCWEGRGKDIRITRESLPAGLLTQKH